MFVRVCVCVCVWWTSQHFGHFDSEVYFKSFCLEIRRTKKNLFVEMMKNIVGKLICHRPQCSITKVNSIVSHGLRIDIAVGRWKHIVCPAYWISGQLTRYYQFFFHEMNHSSHRLHLHGVTCCEQRTNSFEFIQYECGLRIADSDVIHFGIWNTLESNCWKMIFIFRRILRKLGLCCFCKRKVLSSTRVWLRLDCEWRRKFLFEFAYSAYILRPKCWR